MEVSPLFWVGSTRRDMKRFPRAVRREMGFALYRAQLGRKHAHAKPLRGFGGAGVLEIVEDFRGDAHRAVYAVRFTGAIYVIHAFQKKSKRGRQTTRGDLELVRKRLGEAQEHYESWRSAE